ncbi:hypothetical protein ACVJ19_003635 [Bradyrhizobium sp. USDA 376]
MAPGMAHRRRQHVGERHEGLRLEAAGIEAREAPVLADGVEHVGRRADGEVAGNRGLLVPGIEAIGLHADGDVEIEPDAHAELAGQHLGGMQLAVGRPLHEFDELDLAPVRPLVQLGALGFVRLLPFGRPFPPRPVEAMPQHLEAGKAGQKRRAGGAEGVKLLAPCRARARHEAVEGSAQGQPFQRRHIRIGHAVAFAQPRGSGGRVGDEVGGIFRDRLDVDIERIEKQPAVRRIGAAIGRLIVEQHMQRIEADAVGAELLGEPDETGEIGEIADAPIAVRADAVELHGEQPAAIEIAAEGALGRHDHRHVFGRAPGIRQRQAVIAERQAGGPGDDGLARLALRDHIAVAEDLPLQRRRPGCRQFGARMSQGADHDRPADEAVDPLLRQGIEDGFERLGRGDPQLAEGVNEFGLNALDPGLS